MTDLVDRYYGPLYRFALSLAGSESSAGDLTQQTFYLWATKGHQLRDPRRVKTWLFTTLYREFLGGRRREARYRHDSLDENDAEIPILEPSQGDRLDGMVAMECLQRVDERYRVPLTLFYLDQLSYQEIAEALSIPIGTVMSRLSRGKAQMRQLLAERLRMEDAKVIELPGTWVA